MIAHSTQQVWHWLSQVPDPDMPAVSVVDLGIVREVAWCGDGECVVTITPTYSGCPAMQAISQAIEATLQARGVQRVRLQTRLSPAWTTDWISESGRQKLRREGIVPPSGRAADARVVDISRLRQGPGCEHGVCCPRCGSSRTRMLSAFGSAPCRAMHACDDCLEPFDAFKCH